MSPSLFALSFARTMFENKVAVNTGTLAMLVCDKDSLLRAGFPSRIEEAAPGELYLYIDAGDESAYQRLRPLDRREI